MALLVDLPGSLNRQRASQAAGFVAVTIAITALIGQWAGLPMLSSWGSGLPAMRPSAAWLLAALGLAVVHPGKHSRFAFVVGLAVAALAVLGLGRPFCSTSSLVSSTVGWRGRLSHWD